MEIFFNSGKYPCNFFGRLVEKKGKKDTDQHIKSSIMVVCKMEAKKMLKSKKMNSKNGVQLNG